ncbi:hypothetical protein [Streptomyces sp. 058-1L]|uniref:hypothetical protein n=1 Tax=Streptomyces sp. 058-1L TaxID=2789266 RepID=UPI0039802F4E
MATDDQAPSYYMVEDDGSIDMHTAERINEFNWDPDTVGTVMALFPADWTGSGGELVTFARMEPSPSTSTARSNCPNRSIAAPPAR